MRTYLFEATNGVNWGKFIVGIHDVEWGWCSTAEPDGGRTILNTQGWTSQHIWVFDMATGEGALFWHGGYARNDLNKHRIHVCILFEGFLEWLYRQDIRDIEKLPRLVHLPHVEPGVWGYRRPGTADNQEST